MGLFKKKCEYCGNKIEKVNEISGDVKVPGFIGTREKAFCCEGCLKNYKKEIENHMKNSKSGGCCR